MRSEIHLANRKTVMPPLHDDEASARIEIVKRMGTFNHAWPAEYADHQNSKIFMGFSPGRVKCSDIRGVLTYDPITHYLVTGVFEVHATCWAHRLPEVGYEYFDSQGATQCDTTPSGMPYLTKLERDGTKRNETSDVLETLWDTIPYADFTRLPFFT